MTDFLIVEDEDMDFVWKTIQEQQIIFHPDIAPEGKFNYTKFLHPRERNRLFCLQIETF